MALRDPSLNVINFAVYLFQWMSNAKNVPPVEIEDFPASAV